MTDPVNGTANDATTIANANAAIKSVVNGNIDTVNLKDPGTGKVYGSTGAGNAAAVYPPGYLWDTATRTTNYTTTTGFVAILTGAGATFDGAAVEITVHLPSFVGVSGSSFAVQLFRDSTVVGEWDWTANTTNAWGPYTLYNIDTPAAGAHTYSLKVKDSVGGGTLQAGTGGSGSNTTDAPMLLRVKKV